MDILISHVKLAYIKAAFLAVFVVGLFRGRTLR